MQRASRGFVAVNVAIILFAAGYAAQSLAASFRPGTLRTSERTTLPVDAVSFLKRHGVRGRLFNAYDWGGYLVLELPQAPVFVDGRALFYGTGFLYDPYLVIVSGGPNWQAKLDRYGIGTVLVYRTDGLVSVMRESPHWRLVYSDNLAVIYQRQT